jgi:hypothetical protein
MRVSKKDAVKLAKEPISFAMMMQDHELEDVIVAFVSVLNRRKTERGGQN